MNKTITYVTISYELYKNKILGQLSAWERKGFFTKLLFIEKKNNLYILIQREFPTSKNYSDKIIYKCDSKRKMIRLLFQHIELNCYNDYIYMRRLGINVVFSNGYFKNNLNKIFYEIPTYPIDSGINLFRKLILFVEKIYLKKNVIPYVLAVPACIQKKTKNMPNKIIEIKNAVDVGENVNYKRDVDYFTFLFFGNLQAWHGLEHFIKSVIMYKGNYKINMKIYSYETEYYKFLKKKYATEERIHFLGKEESKVIETRNTDRTIGIGGLAYNTRGAEFDTSLKNKDYTAMGIPFIYTLPDISFENYQYSFQVNQKELINIDEIILWFISIKNPQMYDEIKEYARKNLTYDCQIKELYRMIDI